MENVKNKLLPILCLALCLCIVWGAATTAHATGTINVLNKAPEIGDEFYWRVTDEYTQNGTRYKKTVDMTCAVNSTNLKTCLYINSSGYMYVQQNKGIPSSDIYTYNLGTGELYNKSTGANPFNVIPYPYCNESQWSNISCTLFETNIPIFANSSDAYQYTLGNIGIEKAINYNKVLENGAWVEPFDNIEINDNTVDLPKVSNLSHSGFTLTNNPVEKGYLIECYVENGLRDPIVYWNSSMGDDIKSSANIGQYSHNYGLLNPISDAYNYQTVFDLYVDYGIDNVGTLTQACRNFYTDYPSSNKYSSIMGTNKITWSVWGQPFNKNYVFWSANSILSAADISAIDCYSCPLAFTTYKIRYFYYDDSNGWHYGPWSVYTYFSNGDIGYSSVYQDDEDKILETDTIYGEQDSVTGSVNVNTSGISSEEFIDLNNPNNLFGYIRSVTNNVSATMGNFSTLFAAVFTFIPSDMQAMIWLGIAVMVIIGVIKVVKG